MMPPTFRKVYPNGLNAVLSVRSNAACNRLCRMLKLSSSRVHAREYIAADSHSKSEMPLPRSPPSARNDCERTLMSFALNSRGRTPVPPAINTSDGVPAIRGEPSRFAAPVGW